MGADYRIGKAAFLITRHRELVRADCISGSARNNNSQEGIYRLFALAAGPIGNTYSGGRDRQAEQQNGHTDFDWVPDGARKHGCIDGAMTITLCGPDGATVNSRSEESRTEAS